MVRAHSGLLDPIPGWLQARDPQRLIALRQKLQKNRDASALFDAPKLTANIEAAYLRMWQAWLSGEAPAAFSVESA